MNVALPEIDGRILTRAVSFKAPLGRDPETEVDLVGYRPVADRVAFVAELARNWARLRNKPPAERRMAVILANYPNRDGRIGNGVGLDTPASAIGGPASAGGCAAIASGDVPDDTRQLIAPPARRPDQRATQGAGRGNILLRRLFGVLRDPAACRCSRRSSTRWGPGERDPFFREGRLDCGRFAIPGFRAGNLAVLIQPARGYNIDPKATYHDPALVPPHAYLAAYAWLAQDFRADAVIHLGKHGTLEWLPGKALALSAECFPEAVLPPLPHLYPFIVNDPGEGTQAKRRAQAVIVDHLTPPLTRAGSYGLSAELERLIDEYYEAAQGDARRSAPLGAAILEQARAAGLDRRLRHRRRRRADDRVAQARRVSVRAEGIADPRRAARLWAEPAGRAARGIARRLCPTGRAARARKTCRCCARSPAISISATTRWRLTPPSPGPARARRF